MSKRQYKARRDEAVLTTVSSALPTDRAVAVYYRQSTEAQVGNISTAIQTIDMVAYLKQRGWSATQILMIDMDAGISGTTKIDERPGMRTLFDLITHQGIGAVACQDEDRLFRDVTQIQVNIFIEACRAAHVLVITPSMIYDFADEQVGTFHARQFRFKSEMAAEYINSVILGKLARAKRRMLHEGRWVGSHVAVGYMVDKRKTLLDGSQNPNWRKYVPFPSYAEIVGEYFRLFLSYNGNLRQTARHIQRFGPFYPDPTTTKPPDGFFVKYRMNVYGGGYCPSLTGLKDLLTNAIYLGHWSYKRTIIAYNNHEPIVPPDTFRQAFNYISEIALDGSVNTEYHPIQQNARPSLDEERPVERPLYAGYIVACEDGTWHNVGTTWVKGNSSYRYVFWSAGQMKSPLWTRPADYVDEAITRVVLEKLTRTFHEGEWDKTIAAAIHLHEEERQSTERQIATLEQVMQKQIVSLDTLRNAEMIRAVEKRYENAQIEHDRLTQILRKSETDGIQLQALVSLRKDHTLALKEWDTYSRDQKRNVISVYLNRIEAVATEEYGLHLTFCWNDSTSNALDLEHKSAKGTTWTRRETKTLFAMLDAGASQLEIAKTFPERLWGDIYKVLYAVRGKDAHVFSPLLVRYRESYTMYLARVGEHPTPHRAAGGTMWIPNDEARLLKLLDKNASRVELSEAFPARTWRSIREKIVKLRGTKIKINGKGTIQQEETIEMYRLRIGEITQPVSQQTECSAAMTSNTQSSPYHRAGQDPGAN